MLPDGCTAIVSGGARGIERCAAEYARRHALEVVEVLPDRKAHSKGGGLKRNPPIIDASNEVVALWDRSSRGARAGITYARETRKRVRVYRWNGAAFERIVM